MASNVSIGVLGYGVLAEQARFRIVVAMQSELQNSGIGSNTYLASWDSRVVLVNSYS